MPTTPVYAFRYPASTDPADVPTDMGELALDVESALTAKGPGAQIAYATFTANVTLTVVAEASAVSVVSAGAATYDATPIGIEFYAPGLNAAASAQTFLVLFQDGTSVGQIAQLQNTSAGQLTVPVFTRRILTPTAGSHTYDIRGFGITTAGAVFASTGGAGNRVPGYIRIIRA